MTFHADRNYFLSGVKSVTQDSTHEEKQAYPCDTTCKIPVLFPVSVLGFLTQLPGNLLSRKYSSQDVLTHFQQRMTNL